MIPSRIVIIPFLQGTVNYDGTVTVPDIERIFEQWLARHPKFQGPERDYRIIRGKVRLVEEDIETDVVRVTAALSPDLERYDPAEDADLYEEFLPESEPPSLRAFHKIWIEHRAASEQIEADDGTEGASGYLIGEKLLKFLEVAERKTEWRAELLPFIAKIRELFRSWQIAEFPETPRRPDALVHAADEVGHELFPNQVDDSENLGEDAP
ncbi:MAG: hypothetical protein ACYC0X_31065 [Pirellulaceae bacterium]